ncbi:SirA family protein [Haloferax mediterranei ATCC 33500]|uniref:SirA family protein n=1 Tax=Haloferax mediterranei (strain ATCC 33500 / DSM 1411 / JCM 8866 / NBRC 14739 / NCIMB 2177 / R-4) TaxID=523841 RepID=I3R4J4_HALMT|nr:sulfurtransferase TusA family protein [Haloferax mediterranei]AFK19154.1 sirA protein (two-component response regulators) [Haloferax mediterranei ATCC 33500]AHZ21484.1 SirA family protein [Haloferax mediterranei ATCC 33500]EMA03944.1 sirA protein (two-component response regulators) [Haloferax mediterranei ATCC 33500]MDX5989252.1 sulfurtransferase TusA family protein [Haloferax mediterranei ATCC 33500]QCQ75623.1 SirA family protein [Haloferax mediterranei ATCC 33500]
MSEYEPTDTLDVKGLSCPMPVVKTRGAVDDLSDGEVLEVIATDSGSVSDLKGWADTTDGVSMLDQEEAEEGGEAVFLHYIQKE